MKRKISLENLKVKSFVTNIDNGISKTVKGGLVPVDDDVVPYSLNNQCYSEGIGLISDCCPSEYQTACESQDLRCYEEKVPDKLRS